MMIYALLGSVIVPRYPGLVFAIAILCVVSLGDLIARLYAEPLNRWLRAVLLSARQRITAKGVPVPG